MNDANHPAAQFCEGLTIGGFSDWYMPAKNEQEARRGTIFAALLKLLPFFIFLIPGLIAYTLSAQGKIQLDDANAAFPVMVKAVMPIGLRGVLAGGLLAALMGSLASVYNACSTLYTIDIYKKSHPDATEKELVKVGRIATGVIVLLGINQFTCYIKNFNIFN